MIKRKGGGTFHQAAGGSMVSPSKDRGSMYNPGARIINSMVEHDAPGRVVVTEEGGGHRQATTESEVSSFATPTKMSGNMMGLMSETSFGGS